MMEKKCTHLNQIKEGVAAITPQGCQECLQDGTKWVALRKCLSCGHVGCCDSSVGKHATAHFKETEHPIIEAYGESRKWRWCYLDETYL